MKAICIKNYDDVNSRTTIGKVYEIFEDYDDGTGFCVTNDQFFVADNGDELWYEPDCFISVEQHRENQLKLIGI